MNVSHNNDSTDDGLGTAAGHRRYTTTMTRFGMSFVVDDNKFVVSHRRRSSAPTNQR